MTKGGVIMVTTVSKATMTKKREERLKHLRSIEEGLQAQLILAGDRVAELRTDLEIHRQDVRAAFIEAEQAEEDAQNAEVKLFDKVEKHDSLAEGIIPREAALNEAIDRQLQLTNELSWVQNEIEELTMISIGVDVETDEISILDGASAKLDDYGHEDILFELVLRPDCQDFKVSEITTLARAIKVAQNLKIPHRLVFLDERFESIALDYLPD